MYSRPAESIEAGRVGKESMGAWSLRNAVLGAGVEKVEEDGGVVKKEVEEYRVRGYSGAWP